LYTNNAMGVQLHTSSCLLRSEPENEAAFVVAINYSLRFDGSPLYTDNRVR